MGVNEGWRRYPWGWQPYSRPRDAAGMPGLTPEEREALAALTSDKDLSTVSLSGCSFEGVAIPRIVNGRVVRDA